MSVYSERLEILPSHETQYTSPNSHILLKTIDIETGELIDAMTASLSKGEGIILMKDGDVLEYEHRDGGQFSKEIANEGALYFRLDRESGSCFIGKPNIGEDEIVSSSSQFEEKTRSYKITGETENMYIIVIWGESHEETMRKLVVTLPKFFKDE